MIGFLGNLFCSKGIGKAANFLLNNNFKSNIGDLNYEYGKFIGSDEHNFFIKIGFFFLSKAVFCLATNFIKTLFL
jgi:hypothetical protein